MKCEKCQDVGFIEHNAGLLTEFCNCEIGKEILEKKRAIYGIPEEVADDSNSGTRQPDTDTGSPDTSQSEKPKRRKTKKKARKRAS